MAIGRTRMASNCSALSICANVVLLIVTVSLLLRDPLSTAGKPRPQKVVPRSHVIFRTRQSPPPIRTTQESMYVMHGDGNFRDDDEHLLNYIRSLMSRQGPGGRNLSSDPSRVHFSQVSTGQLGLDIRQLWATEHSIRYAAWFLQHLFFYFSSHQFYCSGSELVK